jgi:hypothetical protein
MLGLEIIPNRVRGNPGLGIEKLFGDLTSNERGAIWHNRDVLRRVVQCLVMSAFM